MPLSPLLPKLSKDSLASCTAFVVIRAANQSRARSISWHLSMNTTDSRLFRKKLRRATCPKRSGHSCSGSRGRSKAQSCFFTIITENSILASPDSLKMKVSSGLPVKATVRIRMACLSGLTKISRSVLVLCYFMQACKSASVLKKWKAVDIRNRFFCPGQDIMASYDPSKLNPRLDRLGIIGSWALSYIRKGQDLRCRDTFRATLRTPTHLSSTLPLCELPWGLQFRGDSSFTRWISQPHYFMETSMKTYIFYFRKRLRSLRQPKFWSSKRSVLRSKGAQTLWR